MMAPRQPQSARSKPRRKERGQSLVELALAMPLLLLLMLGTIDIGRVFFTYIELRNAVREGASYGSRFPDDTAGTEDAVTSHSAGIATGTSVTVTCSGDCVSAGGTGLITVFAQRQFEPLMGGFLDSFGLGAFTISASSSARVLS